MSIWKYKQKPVVPGSISIPIAISISLPCCMVHFKDAFSGATANSQAIASGEKRGLQEDKDAL